MKITHNLAIDLQRRGNLQKIDVVQGDAYTRLVNISLYNNGVLWDVPANSGILVRYHKPDGTSGIYEELPDGSPAGVIEENNVLITLAPQMLTAPGKVPTQVSIVIDDQVLSTFSFIVDVEEDSSKGAVGSENYHSWKSSFIPQTSGAFVGQYLEITAVDSYGRVEGVKAVVNPAIQAELMASDAKRAATESGYLANEASETAKSAYAYAKLASENATNANELATSVSGKADEALKTANDANNLSARNADDIADLMASKLPQVTGAKVGQYIKITEVDDLGRVVAFEAVNAPTSGSISGDIEMHGDSINNVGSLSFIGPSNTSVDGFWIQSGAAVSNEDGSKMAVVEFYSSDTDDNVVIRNVAPGVEDSDVVNLAQLNSVASGKLDADKLPEAVNAALAQAKASGEFDGEDGTSVTVKSVSESTADGGSNVVTFSDGNTLTVKNGSKGDKGDAYKLNDTDKDTIVNAVIAANSLPDYWLTHLSAKIPSINTAMESAGRNKSAFYFYTDAHRISSANMTPAILRYLYRHTSINKTNNGGDFFEPFATGADNLATMRNYMADMRSIPNHHSVIGNHDEDNESLASDTQLYGFYLAWEENNDIVWGGYNYYYIDNKAENTRYLYLDIGKNFGKTGAIMVRNEQMQFVIDSLASLPEGWHAVPIAHIWYDYEISAIPDYVLNVLAVFDAYNGRTTGSVTHNGSKFDYDFAEAVGNVEFCIGGHCHADQVHYSNGGIPIIITDTDSTARKGSAATLGTITEGCIDAVVADYNTRKIKLIRIGRGADRTINIPAYQPEGPEEIVNILNVYNIQYNKRYSPTSQGYKDANGVIAFSIPFNDVKGKTIYFKGFTNITDSSSGQVSAWYYAKDGSTTCGVFKGATNSNVFTATQLKESNGVYSIVVNEGNISDHVPFSEVSRLQVQMVLNKGTAVNAADLANCIMTIDQPIEV